MTAPHLLRPRLAISRRALGERPARAAMLAALVALFWGALFAAVLRLLGWVGALGELGPVLAERLLVLVLLGLLAMLLVSGVITALGTFYLADDVPPLLAAPVPLRRLHHARFLETLLASSWMVLLVLVPVLAAYAVRFGAGAGFVLGAIVAVVPFLVVPAALGVLLATALVLAMPARGVRDGLVIGSAVAVAALVAAVRFLAPERLAHPAGLVGFAAYLVDAGAPGSPWLPSTWVAEVLVPLLGLRAGTPAFHAGLLASTAVALFLVSATVVEAGFVAAWSRAQTGRAGGGEAERRLWRGLGRATAPLPRLTGVLLAKDLTVFLRDPAQWSQLLLVGALVAIYLYNFTALPLGGEGPLAMAMRDLATVLNLGLGAFVATAVAVRFVYPLPSLEGRAWWIVRVAPVRLERVWTSKFWSGFLPLALLGVGLVAGTNGLLGVPPRVTAAALPVVVALLAAIVSLGLAFGAVHAELDAHDAARIATGFGAILYMLAAVALIAVVVALAAWPVERLLLQARMGGPLRGTALGLVVAGLAGGVGLSAAAFVVARRAGLRALARLPV